MNRFVTGLWLPNGRWSMLALGVAAAMLVGWISAAELVPEAGPVLDGIAAALFAVVVIVLSMAVALHRMQRVIAERTAALERTVAAARATEAERRRTAEHFQALIENAADLIAIVDVTGLLRYVSPALERLLGHRPADWIGASVFDLVHPDDLAPAAEAFARGVQQPHEAHTPLTCRIRHLDGSWRVLETTGTNMLDGDTVLGVIINARDITDRTEMERALRENELRYRSLVENSGDLISQLDESGTFVYASPGYETMLGWAPADLVGRSCLEFIHPDDLPTIAAAVDEFHGGRHQFRFRHRTEGWRWFESRAQVFLNERGERCGVVIARDITERKRAADEIERAKLAAEAASRAKSEFLANMSHEIRTPLNAVIGMTDIVLRSELSAEQRDELLLAKGAAEGLLEVLNDLLDFSKIEAGKFSLEPVEFDLAALVDEVVRIFTRPATEKGLRLSGVIAPGTPTWLYGDRKRLRQVLFNLLGNAVKFTAVGEVNLLIEGTPAANEPAPVTFTVCDSGIGIAPEKQAAIFRPFEQADGSMTRRYGGTGLGLAICAKLVDLMGGRIWVESALGEGSRFRFTAHLVPATAPIRATAAPAERRFDRPWRHLRVLLAEDNPINQRVALRMLNQEGHAVTVAADGRRVLDLTACECFDVVLMDVQMPEMDGLEATAALRAREAASGAPRVPIIAMTAHALSGDRERCLAAGMDGYVSKPVRREDLLSAIDAAVEAADSGTGTAGLAASSA